MRGFFCISYFLIQYFSLLFPIKKKVTRLHELGWFMLLKLRFTTEIYNYFVTTVYDRMVGLLLRPHIVEIFNKFPVLLYSWFLCGKSHY